MSLLQNDSDSQDDAALGKDYAQGTSHVVVAAVIAALVISGLIAFYFLVVSRQPPPPSVGEVTSVWVYPLHTVTPDVDASGMATTPEEYDQVLVFAQVRLRNQSKAPLILHQVLTNIKMDDGTHSSYAADLADYQRIFIAYPQLSMLHDQPFPIAAILEPGQTVQGMMICAFRMTAAEWAKHKDLNFSFGFRYQPTLTLTPTTPVQTPTTVPLQQAPMKTFPAPKAAKHHAH